MYKFGTIVLIPFPFTDLSSSKLRPALIVSKTNQRSQDLIVSFISSKSSKSSSSNQFIIKASDKYFKQTGLKMDSIVRLDKLASLSKKIVLGELGFLHPQILEQVKKNFYSVFGF